MSEFWEYIGIGVLAFMGFCGIVITAILVFILVVFGLLVYAAKIILYGALLGLGIYLIWYFLHSILGVI